jgi:phosphocarrier protein HPr
MPEKTLFISNRHGLHARPAAQLVQLASRYSAEVTLRKDDLEVNGKSIMGVMMLAAEIGSQITVITQGNDAESALVAICELFENRFGEE